MMGSLMLQRQNFQEAKGQFDTVLDSDWTHLHANLLMGFFYKLTNWPEMSRKYFAIAKTKRMRDLGLLPPKSSIPKNFRTQSLEFKVDIIDWQKVKTIDEQLTQKENDLLFFDLIDFLLAKNVFGVADIALEFINDTSSVKFLMTLAQIRVLQTRYTDATTALDKLLGGHSND